MFSVLLRESPWESVDWEAWYIALREKIYEHFPLLYFQGHVRDNKFTPKIFHTQKLSFSSNFGAVCLCYAFSMQCYVLSLEISSLLLRLIFWAHLSEFDAQMSNCHSAPSVFSSSSVRPSSCPSSLTSTFSTSPLQQLHRISRNLTRSENSRFSTKFVILVPIGQ